MATHTDILLSAIKSNLSEDSISWLIAKSGEIKSSDQSRAFYLTFGMIPRKTGDKIIELPIELAQEWVDKYPGLDVSQWTVDQLCRVYLMLNIPPKFSHDWLKQLFTTADMNELVALYKGLYLLENAADFIDQASEGVRTNMVPVFDAIALNNPFPSTYFSDQAWNQMVLKAIFMDRPIYRIEKLDERNNPALSETLIDYAHERWSAKRQVVPELWRLINGNVNEELLYQIKMRFDSAELLEKEAYLKLANASQLPEAKEWISRLSQPLLRSWEEIGKELEKLN